MPFEVLVIDDSMGVRQAARAALAPLAGCVVRDCGDAEAAAACLALGPARLVLCDVVLPGRAGDDFCRELKARDPDTVVLLMASAFEAVDPARSVAAGADGWLAKPFTAEELRGRVRVLMRRPAGAPVQPRRQAEAPVEPVSTSPSADLGALADRLIEPLAERLVGPLRAELGRHLADAAERLVMERIRDLERQAEGAPSVVAPGVEGPVA